MPAIPRLPAHPPEDAPRRPGVPTTTRRAGGVLRGATCTAAAALLMGVGPCAPAQEGPPSAAGRAAAAGEVVPAAEPRAVDVAGAVRARGGRDAGRPTPERLDAAAARVRAARALVPDVAGTSASHEARAAARAAFDSAAVLLPELGDWFAWRAAALEPDATARAARLASIVAPAAAERRGVAEAWGREAAGDLAGAAAAWEALGRPGEAARRRLRLADATPDGRRAVQAGLLAAVDPGRPVPAPVASTPAEQRRDAARVLDSLAASGDAPLAPADRLLLARALAGGGAPRSAAARATLARAVAHWSAAFAAGVGRADDRARAAETFAALGRWREAADGWDAAVRLSRAGPTPSSDQSLAITGDRPADVGGSGSREAVGDWAYQAARARLRAGDGGGAVAALRAIPAAHAGTAAVPRARMLLAELAADGGRWAEARAAYAALAAAHPDAPEAPRAALQGALLALAEVLAGGTGDAGAARTATARTTALDAARGLDAAAARWSAGTDGEALRYWAGRAWRLAGDADAARARWRALLGARPADAGPSYHAERAAARLGVPGWRAPAPGDAPARDPVADGAARRAALLERVGLAAEAGLERDWLARWADAPGAATSDTAAVGPARPAPAGASARRLAAATALLAGVPELEGEGVPAGVRPGPAIRLAQRAVGDGAPRTAAVERLLQPLVHGALLRDGARRVGLDPALAAALVKQESNFTADAVSPAGALGLMQVMPATGRALWRGLGDGRPWRDGLLLEPAVNVPLGMRHLADALRGWPDPILALAAYNAGGGRVRRWRARPGHGDAELFAERIPFAETRDYVRIVLRNRAAYRALYGL